MDESINLTPHLESDEDAFFSDKIESFGTLVWRRFRKHKLALFGMIVMTIMLLAAIFAPFISPFPPEQLHLELVAFGRPLPPSLTFLFGTDNLGRCYFSRTLHGARVSLLIGFSATLISTFIGLVIGSAMGFYGGIIDVILSRIIEVLMSVPMFLLLITLNVILGPSTRNIIFVLGGLGWMGIARQVRAQFLSLKEQDFVQGAVALGLKDTRITIRHILPNALTPVIVSASMAVAAAVITEAVLSYFGFGIQEPTASWGSMLRFSQAFLHNAPWMMFFPGALISITALSLNFIGDGLRDALDPRMSK